MEITQYVLVFLEGIMSFFSPCIIPILPVYLGQMGNTKEKKNKLEILKNTMFFVFGIATAFILLGIAATTIGVFLEKYKNIISIISGIIIILFSLVNLDIIKIKILEKEKRIKVKN